MIIVFWRACQSYTVKTRSSLVAVDISQVGEEGGRERHFDTICRESLGSRLVGKVGMNGYMIMAEA